ncbi:MAG: hypothetical protein AAFN12_17870 [Cyanobacteria bacterium J06560_2]
MKLVQIIRPLFLAAVGLHAALLFIPTGPSEPVVIEDVELTELEAAAKPTPPVPGALPVPDPNVATSSTPSAIAKKPTPTAVAATPTAARPAAARAASRAATATTATRRTTTGNTSSANTRGRSSASTGDSGRRTSTSSTSESSSGSDSASSGRSAGQSTNFIATLEEEAPDPGANASDSNSQRSAANGPSSAEKTPSGSSSDVTVDMLIAKVTQEVPDSLRAFASKLNRSLTYDAENTDDESAQQAKNTWQADIQRQANIGQIEQMAPTEIDELTQVEYPIESSIKAEGRSLRRCLSEDPTTAEVGVLFDVQGNVAGEPALLRSTGYGALNEEIKALVAAYEDFPSDRASKAYTFEVEVFYDSEACLELVDLQK